MSLPYFASRQLRTLPWRRWASSSTKALAGLRSVSEQDISHFRTILPESSILSTLPPASLSPDEISTYNKDWMGKYMGSSSTILKPKTTQEVSKILKWCWENRIAVVPQGGNTGLVGGSVPLRDELVINLGSMTSIRSFDPVTGVLVADAGCILESLSEYIAPHGYIMPLDLGAKGSCMIGGNVATNAGGLRLLRYGSLHGTVLGLEVVLPDGTVLNQLSQLRKDNTGYDLKQLFIGAEGTLGIITAVSIMTAPAPQATNNLILALPSYKNVLPLFTKVKQQLSEILSAFEYIDRQSYNLAVKHGQGKALDDSEISDAECFILIETSGGKREHDEEKLNELLESLMEAEEPLINTGVLSQSPTQFASLWALREGITEAISKEGKAYKYDISIPLASFKDVVDTTREHLREKGLLREGFVRHVVGYGHVGDGNLHLNIVADQYSEEIQNALEPFVYELVAGYKGSVSAEHGIGVMKTHALQYSKDNDTWTLTQTFEMIFVSDGTPLKFFIQKDLPDDLRNLLENNIRESGGTIVEKVPIRGYIVIQPDTPEAARLFTAWQDVERPCRYFVPISWIDACRKRGKLLPRIFVENSLPVKIHLHKTIANLNTRDHLVEQISLHGGDPTASYVDAKVIIASSELDDFKEMRKEFQGSEIKFVENIKWIERCISQNYYFHTPNAVRNPGGRRTGDERTPFSEDDENNLCSWIAAVIPFKESGGRTGNKIYQELVSRADQPEFAWAGRHTWQSWRERYKKNADRLDQHITAIVSNAQATGRMSSDNAQFGQFKLNEGSHSRNNRRKRETSNDAVDPSASKPKEEPPVREVNDPPSSWTNPNRPNDPSPDIYKRQKASDGTYRTFMLTPQNGLGPSFRTETEFAADFGSQNPIDLELSKIATDTHFYLDDIRKLYLKNNNIINTRAQFEHFRAVMNNTIT